MDFHAAAFGEVPVQQPVAMPTGPVPSLEQNTGGYTGHGAGKRDIFDRIWAYTNRSLMMFKLFYFFFFAAFGSLFPLISIYFKQLGMSGTQTGLLNGCRALVESFGAPFWSHVAEKWKKGKEILIASIVSWILFTLIVSMVQPDPKACLVLYTNTTDSYYGLLPPNTYEKWSTPVTSVAMDGIVAASVKRKGQSPITLDVKLIGKTTGSTGLGKETVDYIDPQDFPPKSLVMPRYSTVVYTSSSINQCFALLLMLILIGEIFSCPSVCLADSSVLLYLEGETHTSYGKQRMFGSVGWGISMFIIGLALDNSQTFSDHPCRSAGKQEKNYIVCFTAFTVFMLSALLVATQFSFGYEGSQESMYFKLVKDKLARVFLGRQTKARSKFENEELDPNNESEVKPMSNETVLEKQLGVKFSSSSSKPRPAADTEPSDPYLDEVTANAQLKVTKWGQVLKNFATPRLSLFLFVVWFMGLGMGIVFSFLFWHMQEIGGSPTMYGIASIINHVSEIASYYFSKPILEKIGHINMLYAGLLANVARFLWVSWISNAWWILPFEFLQGLTHAGVWAACCSYVANAFPSDVRLSTQGFLQGIHHGLGRGLGAIFGGVMISSYGSHSMFQAYGAASAVVLLLFMAVEILLNRRQGTTDQAAGADAQYAQPDQQQYATAQPVIGGSEYYETSTGYSMPYTGAPNPYTTQGAYNSGGTRAGWQ